MRLSAYGACLLARMRTLVKSTEDRLICAKRRREIPLFLVGNAKGKIAERARRKEHGRNCSKNMKTLAFGNRIKSNSETEDNSDLYDLLFYQIGKIRENYV